MPERELRNLETLSRRLYEGTEYALLGWGYGVCFLGLSLITDRRSNVTMGLPDQWLMMLLTEKETCHEMMGRSVDASIRCLEAMHEAVGDRCFAWGIASDDSGTQRGEFIRPELWAEMIAPHYARLCAWVHGHTRWRTFLHSCGSVYHLIPHFIDAGIDILNPVQTSAANMDPARLKREFGDRLCFWGGGCDTQRVLATGSPAAGPRARARADGRLRSRRRVRVHPGAQRPGQRARPRTWSRCSTRRTSSARTRGGERSYFLRPKMRRKNRNRLTKSRYSFSAPRIENRM